MFTLSVSLPGVITNLPEQLYPVNLLHLLLELPLGHHELVHVLGDLPLLAGGQQGLQPRPEMTQSGNNTGSVLSMIEKVDTLIESGAVISQIF